MTYSAALYVQSLTHRGEFIITAINTLFPLNPNIAENKTINRLDKMDKQELCMGSHQIIYDGSEMVDTTGKHIGTVDHVDGILVRLTEEGFSDGLHHFVLLASVISAGASDVLVEPKQETSIEAVAGAIRYARRVAMRPSLAGAICGTKTGSGGSGVVS